MIGSSVVKWSCSFRYLIGCSGWTSTVVVVPAWVFTNICMDAK